MRKCFLYSSPVRLADHEHGAFPAICFSMGAMDIPKSPVALTPSLIGLRAALRFWNATLDPATRRQHSHTHQSRRFEPAALSLLSTMAFPTANQARSWSLPSTTTVPQDVFPFLDYFVAYRDPQSFLGSSSISTRTLSSKWKDVISQPMGISHESISHPVQSNRHERYLLLLLVENLRNLDPFSVFSAALRTFVLRTFVDLVHWLVQRLIAPTGVEALIFLPDDQSVGTTSPTRPDRESDPIGKVKTSCLLFGGKCGPASLGDIRYRMNRRVSALRIVPAQASYPEGPPTSCPPPPPFLWPLWSTPKHLCFIYACKIEANNTSFMFDFVQMSNVQDARFSTTRHPAR